MRQDQGRPDEALALYEGVLEGNPSDAYALRGMARTLASLDRGDEAAGAYERAMDVARHEANGWPLAAGAVREYNPSWGHLLDIGMAHATGGMEPPPEFAPQPSADRG